MTILQLGSLKSGHAGAHLQDMSGARLTITGTMSPVSEDETPSLKEAYRQRHPNSFWIDFGDFAVFRLDPLIIRYNFGFASAGKVC